VANNKKSNASGFLGGAAFLAVLCAAGWAGDQRQESLPVSEPARASAAAPKDSKTRELPKAAAAAAAKIETVGAPAAAALKEPPAPVDKGPAQVLATPVAPAKDVGVAPKALEESLSPKVAARPAVVEPSAKSVPDRPAPPALKEAQAPQTKALAAQKTAKPETLEPSSSASPKASSTAAARPAGLALAEVDTSNMSKLGAFDAMRRAIDADPTSQMPPSLIDAKNPAHSRPLAMVDTSKMTKEQAFAAMKATIALDPTSQMLPEEVDALAPPEPKDPPTPDLRPEKQAGAEGETERAIEDSLRQLDQTRGLIEGLAKERKNQVESMNAAAIRSASLEEEVERLRPLALQTLKAKERSEALEAQLKTLRAEAAKTSQVLALARAGLPQEKVPEPEATPLHWTTLKMAALIAFGFLVGTVTAMARKKP
jgi:hypothetical protein